MITNWESKQIEQARGTLFLSCTGVAEAALEEAWSTLLQDVGEASGTMKAVEQDAIQLEEHVAGLYGLWSKQCSRGWPIGPICCI